VCRYNAPNLLYVNQGDGTFKEMAHAYGLDVVDSSVMAAFADYDRDGYLDLYIATNILNITTHPKGQRGIMFHNNRNGTFTNVTDSAGILGESQSHSATWWDFDNDGWPDLYVANDYGYPDRLYHNNRDGTFTDMAKVLPHTSFSSMGADMGDVNNSGRIDFLAADMAATDKLIHTRMTSGVALIPDLARHLIDSGGKRHRDGWPVGGRVIVLADQRHGLEDGVRQRRHLDGRRLHHAASPGRRARHRRAAGRLLRRAEGLHRRGRPGDR